LRSYTKAATRSAKSAVISDIVSTIRESSAQEGGGFVRFDASHCLWYEVGDKAARDKVGQALRDSIRANTKEVREKKREPCPSSQAPSTVTFGLGSDDLTMLFHEIVMDDKPLTPTKANSTEAWPAQTDNLIEWFENVTQ
jgi:hypothetical protein